MSRAQLSRIGVGFVFLLALVLRLHVLLSTVYLWDEDRDFIPIARSISWSHLPIREFQHPLLPAYFIRASSLLLGETIFSFRFPSLVAGMVTILAAYVLVNRWSGRAAAIGTVLLMGCNEYLIGVSILAVEKAYYLCFAMLGILAFDTFLRTSKPRWLYCAAAAAGCGMLSKELTVFVLFAFFLTLLFSPARHWLWRKEPYLALALFLLVISPDLIWNLGAHSNEVMGYQEHLSRMKPSGNLQVFVFYGREAMRFLAPSIGTRLFDAAPEFASMNFGLGWIVLVGVAVMTFRKADVTSRLLLFLFWPVVIFFTLVESRSASLLIDPTVWFWFDLSLLAAIPLASRWLFEGTGWMLRSLPTAGCVYAVYSAVVMHMGLPQAAVAMDPESVYVLNGRSVPVRAVFLTCMLCPSTQAKLESRRVIELGGGELDPDKSSGLEGNYDQFQLKVAPDAGSIYTAYRLTYRFEFGPVATAQVAVRPGPPGWKPKFWAGDSSPRN